MYINYSFFTFINIISQQANITK